MKLSSQASSLPSSRLACAPFWLTASIAALLSSIPPSASAETWTIAGGSSWGTAANWNPASVPNAIGASATFNGAATGSNAAQTANRTITLDGARTVGAIVFNTDLSTFTNQLATGTGGSLIFDALGAGPATITTMGAGMGNNTISGPMTLIDSLTAIVNNTTASSPAGSLNLTGTIGGPGGFTKQGDGLATFGTGAKTYTGATLLSGGRMRTSLAASQTATSSFTIDAGAQLDLISAGTYTFGSGPMNLNGTGALSGPFAAFAGAIRNDTNLAVTITNAVNLQSNTLLHVQGAATGGLTLNGVIGGIGMLLFTAPGSNADLGKLVLGNDNSYSGGTLVRGGLLTLGAPSADFGGGDVTILSGNAMFSGASARLQLPVGILNAIADTATLSLAGGNIGGVADDGFAELQAGINEIIGGLMLGGVPQGPGTYGSTLSAALFQNDEYFSGTGIVTVVPEPGAAAMLLGGLAMLLGFQRQRSRR